jgi:DNA-directed RNA polymerase subunit K/omega
MNRNDMPNAFEFVAVAGQRARQLLNGCVPRVDSDARPVRIAQQEVAQGLIRKLEDEQDR